MRNAFPGDDPICKRIPLTQSQVTLVSAEDFDRLNQVRWYADWNPLTETFYAKRKERKPDGSYRLVQMHREIMSLEPGDPREVHHLNGNPLDNRRSNLKVVTVAEHKNEHRNDPRKDASQYGIGVYRRKNGRFRAPARVDRRRHYLGTYSTPEEARNARAEFLSRQREEAACRDERPERGSSVPDVEEELTIKELDEILKSIDDTLDGALKKGGWKQ